MGRGLINLPTHKIASPICVIACSISPRITGRTFGGSSSSSSSRDGRKANACVFLQFAPSSSCIKVHHTDGCLGCVGKLGGWWPKHVASCFHFSFFSFALPKGEGHLPLGPVTVCTFTLLFQGHAESWWPSNSAPVETAISLVPLPYLSLKKTKKNFPNSCLFFIISFPASEMFGLAPTTKCTLTHTHTHAGIERQDEYTSLLLSPPPLPLFCSTDARIKWVPLNVHLLISERIGKKGKSSQARPWSASVGEWLCCLSIGDTETSGRHTGSRPLIWIDCEGTWKEGKVSVVWCCDRACIATTGSQDTRVVDHSGHG